TFSRHMAGDVTMQRQHVEELAARVGRVMPGAATQDLQISLEAAQKNLADLESLLNSNPNEADRIARAAQRVSTSRRKQAVAAQMDALHLAKEPIADTLLDERAALEEAVAQDQSERAREVAAHTAANAQIESARKV